MWKFAVCVHLHKRSPTLQLRRISCLHFMRSRDLVTLTFEVLTSNLMREYVTHNVTNFHISFGLFVLVLGAGTPQTDGRTDWWTDGQTFNTLPNNLRDPSVRLSAQQLSDNCWKHTFSLPISTFSALGVSHVMRYINLRYLLTYLLTFTAVGLRNAVFRRRTA